MDFARPQSGASASSPAAAAAAAAAVAARRASSPGGAGLAALHASREGSGAAPRRKESSAISRAGAAMMERGGGGESIFNLLPKVEEERQAKALQHRVSSKFRALHAEGNANSSLTDRRRGANSGIMGMKHPTTDPTRFLKRGAGADRSATMSEETLRRTQRQTAKEQAAANALDALELARSGGGGDGAGGGGASGGRATKTRTGRKEPVPPARVEVPLPSSLKTRKNFISANAVTAILSVPKVQQQRVNYMEKEDFGRVPEYLQYVKEEVKAENEMIDEYVKEQLGINNLQQDAAMPMDPKEQTNLLRSMKHKWDTTNAEYQRLCHLTKYEGGRRARKLRLEEELDSIERDIGLLEKPVFIRKDR